MTVLDTSGFTGTDTWFRHAIARQVTYTEGAKYVAETAGAYWLLDKIAIVGPTIPEEFQVWKLEVGDRLKGEIIVEDGDGHVVHREGLAFTDFPEPGITLWFVDNVILLPSEY